MNKLNLINRLIQQPDNVDLEFLALCRDILGQKLDDASFETFLQRVENNEDVFLVKYFFQGMQSDLWRDILTSEHFVVFSSIVWTEFFKDANFYRKRYKITAPKLIKLFSEEELFNIAKIIIETDNDQIEADLAIKKITNSLPAALKDELFKFNVEISPRMFFKFEEYAGNWNDLLPEGSPLYFEYFNNILLYHEKNFSSFFNKIFTQSAKFDFNLRVDNLNFCEYLCKKVNAHFDGELIAALSKGLISFFSKLLIKSEFKNTLFLNTSADILWCLDPATFPFILKRWKIEKSQYLPSTRNKILRELLVAFYDKKVIKYFVDDLADLARAYPHTHLLDSLDFCPVDFDIYDPQILIGQFKKLNLSLKSKKLISELVESVDLGSYDNLCIHKEGMETLLKILKLEPFNYLYVDYNYLKAITNLVKNKETSEFKIVANLLKEGKAYKENYLKTTAAFLASNLGLKVLLRKSNEMEPYLLKVLRDSQSEKCLAKAILNTTSAFAQKVLFTEIIYKDTFNYSKLFWLSNLLKSGFNYDLVIRFITTNELVNYASELPEDFLKNLKHFFSEERIFSLIMESQKKRNLETYIKDTAYSLNFLLESDLKELALSKIKNSKNLIDLHNKVSDVVKFLSQDNFKLNQDLVHGLSGQKVKDYEIFIPQSNHDLIELGKTLHICVGDGQYGELIKKKRIFIIALKNAQGRYSHCVEVDRGSLNVKQSKTYHNKEMGPVLVSILSEKLFIIR